ncbi:MAG: hypothetical protein IJ191_05160, partial [Treponema sp.]|nr:hypothetical protein [Treponema sp.]
TLGVTFGAAKNVTEHFSVGMTFSGGAFWGAGNDWLLEAGFGALFRFPRLGFLSDVRVGVSVLHLGKTYTATTLPGAYTPSRTADMFPGIGMLKLGAGALFVDTKRFDLGMTLDLSFPSFQNCIVDVGLEFSIIDAVYVSVAESFNIRELVSHYRDVMPSVSIGYRFIFKTGGAQVLAARGWQESEMRVELGWKNLYEQTNAFSGDVLLKFGTQDTEPPVIELWGGE